MSVLRFPRIYFNGKMEWNPPTGNNNDTFPFYDAVNVDLNWPFLEDLQPPIQPDETDDILHQWMCKTLRIEDVPCYVSNVPNNAGNFPAMPASWNLFGSNAAETVDFDRTKTRIIGGETQTQGYISEDPLVGKAFKILGNPFGGKKSTPGRFVDISPWQNTFTALFFDALTFGDEQTGLRLNRRFRMLDRFLNFNWGAINGLKTVTTTWQTCFLKEDITWFGEEHSPLLTALKDALTNHNVKGLMVRFSTYLTLYDQNGVFNDFPKVVPHGGEEGIKQLQELYLKALKNSSEIFFNPAYSNTNGTIGLWLEDEFPTAPSGRRMQSNSDCHPIQLNISPLGPTKVPLGVTSVELHQNTLSLDASNTFPFYSIGNSTGTLIPKKFDLGDLSIGIKQSNTVTEIATLSYDQYSQAAFNKRSGLIDIELTPENAQRFQEEGTLQVTQSGELLLSEQLYTAEIVESGTFIDVGEEKTLTIMLQHQGKPVSEGTTIWVTQYGNPYNITTSDYFIGFEDPTDEVDFVLYTIKDGKSKQALPQFSDDHCPSCNTNIQSSEMSFSRAGLRGTPNVQIPSDGCSQDIDVNYQEVRQSPVGMSLTACVDFVGGETFTKTLENSNTAITFQAVQLAADAKGVVQLTIQGKAAGFPTLAFQFAEHSTPNFLFSFPSEQTYSDFMAPIRVLPNNEALLPAFVDTWNKMCKDDNASQRIWDEFIYPKVLKVFYYLYPIMNRYMPLNQLSRVEAAVDQLIVLISTEYREESTLAMPITRDFPASSRAVLEMWAKELVKKKYPPKPLPLP